MMLFPLEMELMVVAVADRQIECLSDHMLNKKKNNLILHLQVVAEEVF